MNNLRDWLDQLYNTERLMVCKTGINPKFEVMTWIEQYEGKKACFFPEPQGYEIPIVAGILGQRSWAAEAMNVHESEMLQHISKALHNPIPWSPVNQEQAPVHQVVIDKNIDLLKFFPVVTHHEKDAGPYITSGLVHGLNLQTGKQNTSINRMQVHAPDKLGILMLPRDLYAYHQYAESQGLPLPITITIGHDPLTKMSSQMIAPRDQSELEIAGALMGRPLSTVKSYTNNVFIPAEAEISIEGIILPGVKALEGPFGEFPKYYSGSSMLPVIHVLCITHRQKPIFETNHPSGLENIVLGGVPREASLLERIQLNFPNVLDLRLTPGGLGRYHMVVKMKKSNLGEAKNVICCALGCHYDIKFVIVVDDDIDIDDKNQIEWAVATRFQAERDLVVVNGALGSKLDPSAKKHTLSSKIGFDATKYLDEIDTFYVTRVPTSAGYVFTKPDKKATQKYMDYMT
ncbi:3-polyprenyl-4-hydroxybenzoate decarboxylase [Legionella steigerwaltii]|uniref:3-polyprenyl-4-hydroxybenzoate decarboxylase n=1 Tax=Legionella steigerwaltii TaxID=460 RepID=A0A378LD35_9GAMM|nr:UbiD family decarboxylase [Legionella steigerwaltii]KTD78629.1 3-polyprenyl-4-hydroxybenzoate decarboxylase [Legionella steigerwaltii]STY24280.1 3-polyprenyl-4-hydroxybenzoate decarboxylase [Legionella steigerwaltii]